MNFKKFKPITNGKEKLTSKQEKELLNEMRLKYLQAAGLLNHKDADKFIACAYKVAHVLGPEAVFDYLEDLATEVLYKANKIN